MDPRPMTEISQPVLPRVLFRMLFFILGKIRQRVKPGLDLFYQTKQDGDSVLKKEATAD